MGYFSNLAVEVCPADRPDDSYPSAERQLLQRLEDLRERMKELTMEGALYWNGAAYRENSLRYVLPEYLCDIYSAEQAMRLAKADLLSKYAIDASTPDDRSIAGEEMNGYEQITWISLLFPLRKKGPLRRCHSRNASGSSMGTFLRPLSSSPAMA